MEEARSLLPQEGAARAPENPALTRLHEDLMAQQHEGDNRLGIYGMTENQAETGTTGSVKASSQQKQHAPVLAPWPAPQNMRVENFSVQPSLAALLPRPVPVAAPAAAPQDRAREVICVDVDDDVPARQVICIDDASDNEKEALASNSTENEKRRPQRDGCEFAPSKRARLSDPASSSPVEPPAVTAAAHAPLPTTKPCSQILAGIAERRATLSPSNHLRLTQNSQQNDAFTSPFVTGILAGHLLQRDYENNRKSILSHVMSCATEKPQHIEPAPNETFHPETTITLTLKDAQSLSDSFLNGRNGAISDAVRTAFLELTAKHDELLARQEKVCLEQQQKFKLKALEMEQNHSKIVSQLKEREAAISQLNGEVARLKLECMSVRSQLQKHLKDGCSTNPKELSTVVCESLRGEVSDVKRQFSLRAQLAVASVEIRNLRAHQLANSSSVSGPNTCQAENRDNTKQLEREKDEWKTKYHIAQAQLQKQRIVDSNVARVELSKFRTEYEHEIGELKEKVKDESAKNKSLRAQLENHRGRVGKLIQVKIRDGAICDLNSQLKEASTKNSYLRDQLRRTQAKLQQADTRHARSLNAIAKASVTSLRQLRRKRSNPAQENVDDIDKVSADSCRLSESGEGTMEENGQEESSTMMSALLASASSDGEVKEDSKEVASEDNPMAARMRERIEKNLN